MSKEGNCIFVEQQYSASTVVVLDFETTGLSPDMGDRAIEIGAVLLHDGKITERFQKLMNPGFRVSSFIENYTGISNTMLRNAGGCEAAMREFAEFVGDYNLVAHNASFDKRFLDAELYQAGAVYKGEFACSMLIARRLFQDSPNHQLGTLVHTQSLPNEGIFHRALADAEMTAHLWIKMLDVLDRQYDVVDVPFTLMQKISKTPKPALGKMLRRHSITNSV